VLKTFFRELLGNNLTLTSSTSTTKNHLKQLEKVGNSHAAIYIVVDID